METILLTILRGILFFWEAEKVNAAVQEMDMRRSKEEALDDWERAKARDKRENP